jgi:hypothetical protein
MRYRLRTLLIAMLFGPPLLAGTWFASEPIRGWRRADVWEDVGGPGAIDNSIVGIGCSIDENGNWVCRVYTADDEDQSEDATP